MKLPFRALSVDHMCQVKAGALLSVLRTHARELCFGYAVFSQSMFSVYEKSLKPNVETVKRSKRCRNQTGFKYDG